MNEENLRSGAPARRSPARRRELIINTWIDSVTSTAAVSQILQWAIRREPRYVCICNVHSVVTARKDSGLREAINNADLATPDGKPVAWLIGRRLKIIQERVSGAELTMALCEQAATQGIAVAFFGGTVTTLHRLQTDLARRFPQLRVAAAISPPFRALTAVEGAEFISQLNQSGAGIVFVGLGCPKQERWMATHTVAVHGVLIGIGAAFDFIAGTVMRPPLWMQRSGLEWLGRLLAEPRRLWRRYLITNSSYIWYVIQDFCFRKPDNASHDDG